MDDSLHTDMSQTMAAGTFHALLARQISRHMGPEQLAVPGMSEFLDVVSKTYESFDRDLKISDHAYQISEAEFRELNAKLRLQDALRQASIAELRQAIAALDTSLELRLDGQPDDLLATIAVLQDRIGHTKRLEKDLLNAKTEAELAAKTKSEFLSVMSHEIRTPLNAIVGLTFLLATGSADAEETAESIGLLKQSASNLLALINDILDFSKIEEQKLELQSKPFKIGHLLHMLVKTQKLKAQQKGIELLTELDPRLPELLLGDELRLNQIVTNLVQNAIKFTHSGQVLLKVELLSQAHAEATIRIVVQDSGIGMSKEELPKIFGRFLQANEGTQSHFGGSGLGLAIVKNLVEMHGSTIEVESEKGEGTRFWFDIPFQIAVAKPETPLADTFGQTLPRLDGLRILVAEDVELNVVVLRRVLQRQGATVDAVADGAEAVEAAKLGQHHIILMDLHMPNMNGYEATKAIKVLGIKTPIIALSASFEPITKVLNSGMVDFILKPFIPHQLVASILQYALVP